MPRVHRAMDEGDFDGARARLVAALEETPNDRELLWWLVRVEMLAERPTAARVVLHRIIALDATDVEAYLELGVSYELERDYAQALEAYVRATERAPTSAKAFRWLGQRLLRWGQAEEAVAPLTRATELDAEDVETWGALGRAKLVSGDAAGAEVTLRAAVRRHAGSRDLQLALGLVLLAERRWQDALAVYDTVVERWPRFAPAHVGRGILLDTLGRRDEALHAFEQAALIDPRERRRLALYRRGVRQPPGDEPDADAPTEVERSSEPQPTPPAEEPAP